MPIVAASGGRSSNPRERANQYQGPPSGIAVVKIAIVVGHVPASLSIFLSNSFQEHSTRPQWKSQVLAMAWRCLALTAYKLWTQGLPREAEKDYYRKQS